MVMSSVEGGGIWSTRSETSLILSNLCPQEKDTSLLPTTSEKLAGLVG